jgi:D-arabinose 1-dehydrogenase-like Zn-dependent alcohol dehydrogenase
MTASTTLERSPAGVGTSIINGYTARGSGQPLEIMAYEVGPLGDREVEIKVTHCGICHSDVSMIDNEWHMTRYPIVPGHEIIGTVSAFGRGVRSGSVSVSAGNRVRAADVSGAPRGKNISAPRKNGLS